jgi:TQO small subunit DoxA
MAPFVAEFEKEHPDYKGRIYWETIPPGLLVKQIEAGGTITSVRFHVYLDAGTPEAPAHVVAAGLLTGEKQPVADWNAAQLSKLPKTDFANDYAYNKFEPGPYGIRRHGDIARARFRYKRRCEVHTADGCGRSDLLRNTRK